jgi:hypothetical protein
MEFDPVSFGRQVPQIQYLPTTILTFTSEVTINLLIKVLHVNMMFPDASIA